MDSAPSQIYQSPAILYFFSVFSAMAIVFGILRWLWLMRNDDTTVGSLNAQIIWGQLYIMLAVTLISFLMTVYNFVFTDNDMTGVTIIPEIIILLGSSYFFARHYKRNGLSVAKGLLRQLRNIVLWVAACALGWGLTVVVGFGVYYLIVFLSHNEIDFILLAIMVTGFLWNAPTIGLHLYIRRTYPGAKTLMGVKSHSLLVPIAISYLILMIPLGLQEAANSPKFQQHKYEKPLRKI